jgi:hypothetical protein
LKATSGTVKEIFPLFTRHLKNCFNLQAQTFSTIELMMSIRPAFLLILFAFLSHAALAQTNTCECCSYSSLQFRDEYETIFPRLVIKKKGITEVIVYTSPSDSGQQPNTRYKEITFKFDQKGQVIARLHYNRNGKPHSIYQFERNGSGKIYKQTFNYLDSTEQILTQFSAPEITDYFYNLKDRLIKIKKRNANGLVMPDIMSDFTKYEYDKAGRVIKESQQYYYVGQSTSTSSQVTTYTYKDKNLYCQSQTFTDGKLFLTTKTQFNKGWKPLHETGYSNKSDSISFQTTYEYNATGKLTRYETKANTVVSECVDKGTYIDIYSYNGDGLLTNITHAYEDKKCEMLLEYKGIALQNQQTSL